MLYVVGLVALSLGMLARASIPVDGQSTARNQSEMSVRAQLLSNFSLEERNVTHAVILPTILRILNASTTTYDESRGFPLPHLSNTRLSDLENDNGTIQLQQRYRARKKQERLFMIQAQILERLQVSPTKNTNLTSPLFSQEERQRMSQIFERMRLLRHQNKGTDAERSNQIYAERFQSFYPSCQPPNNTDRALWEQTGTMRLFYSIIFPRPSQTTETNILSSKLRLYKFHSPEIQQSNCVDCGGVPSSYPSFILPTPTLTIAVYHFLKPLRANRREKKFLVDSRTIAADLEGWIELNIATSTQHWYQNRHKNYGLDIDVEDSSGNKLDPSLYFRRMNCSENASVQEPPFPNLLDIHPDMAENESSLFDNETYPTLDLQTTEFSREQTGTTQTVLANQRSSSGQQQQQQQQQASQTNVLTTNQAQPVAAEARMIRKRHAGTLYLRPAWYSVCRRKQIFVTYKDLGLDDMASDPEGGVSVGYCSGSCLEEDHTTHQNSNMERKGCVPTSFRPLHLEYMDEDGQSSELILHDISAKSCACAA